MVWKERKIPATSFLFFIKQSQVIRVQSSTKITNHQISEEIEMGTGPQTSEWNNINGVSHLFEFIG